METPDRNEVSPMKAEERKRRMRGIMRRRFVVIILLLFQILWIAFMAYSSSIASRVISGALTLLSFGVVLYIIGRDRFAAYKFLWVVTILIFPLFGGLFYILFRVQISSGSFRRSLERTQLEVEAADCATLPQAQAEWPAHALQASYLQNYCGYPIYDRTETEFLPSGEAFFERLLEDIDKAEKYLFLEFFIIDEGKMWDTILERLERKVAAGVDVRVIYDDIGCLKSLPPGYWKRLEAKGIRCKVFNAFRPVLTSMQNNRDHRKILSVDGRIAYTGGANLADEYINEYERFGHWKDCAIRLEGEGAWGLTRIFLSTWNWLEPMDVSPESFRPAWPEGTPAGAGYVQPYADSPMDDELVGEQVYLRMIQRAEKYIYINTPYLLLDEVLEDALESAAKSGVDVRIVTPHIADKKMVHKTTRSYYGSLLEAGVKIYEYTPGFIHSKTMVCDDTNAVIGTINLDYRSLYLHFECGVWLCGSKTVTDVKEDFLATLPLCEEMTLEKYKPTMWRQMARALLRLAAPLL